MTLVALFLLGASGAIGADEPQKDSKGPAEITLVRVNITSETRGAVESVEIYGKHVPNYRPTIIQVLASTGVVMDEQGHVLTFLGYRWVDLQSPQPRVDIFTREGQKYKGKLIGIDQSMGTAVVLALEGKLKRTPICASCEIRDGTTIVTPVIEGSGFQQFKSVQIVSAGATGNAADNHGSLILTMNQPISGIGEPILNTDHHVLGFVASQKSTAEDGDLMGVRTVVYPMSQLLNSAEKILQAGGNICTGWLGVYTDPFSPLGKGVVVTQIERDSPAQRAGLNPEDTILKFNGSDIRDATQFIRLVQNSSIGSRVTLDVLRQGKPLHLSALIEARKPSDAGKGNLIFRFPPVDKGADVPFPKIGIETTPLTPELADALQIPGQNGLLVLKVADDMAAARAGVLDGDVITAVDGDTILDPQVLATHIQSRGWGGRLILKLLRKGIERTTTILLPKSPTRKP
jgi:serine protease Do